MEFPKPIMNIADLQKMGFSEYRLREIAQKVGYPVAFRVGGKTSPILFDSQELQKYIKKQSEMMERR